MNRVTITTAELVLEYDRSKEAAGSRTFSSEALVITLTGTGNLWHPLKWQASQWILQRI